MNLETLRFGPDGLIPAVVQDAGTGRVLTLAYMNRESLDITLQEGYTCFFSRSRQQLWRKGETSGNTQRVVGITADCDGDALVVTVEPAGPACHTGAESCFYQDICREEDPAKAFSTGELYRLLQEREQRPQGSYTTYLFDQGTDKILKKVGEECTEVIIAAKGGDRAELVYELADLLYHSLVLMVDQGIPLGEVRQELARRQVVDHKKKQEKMG